MMYALSEKINSAYLGAKIRLQMALTPSAEPKKESGSHIIEVLGTLIIALIILIFFKDAIVEIVKDVVNDMKTHFDNLFKGINAGAGGGGTGE